ncbi:MAG: ParB/RepB/Spo0J family partition protein, partial [Oscillospiraceae bacterium]|nr:ParB/RepB/Spo0J family partition protein [Oscillospiraceae bacterium]
MAKGLGRGLGALLGEAAMHAQESGSIQLPLNQLEARADQPRKYFEEKALEDLADSIRRYGILQPIIVRLLSPGRYQIISGERRFRAAHLAGLTQVPAVVIDADNCKSTELALIENLQREDLNPVEEAGGYRLLMEQHGLTQEEVAVRIGKSRPAVANALRLLALPDSVLRQVEDGVLSAGHARALLALKDAAAQEKTAARIQAEGLSVRQTEALVKRLQNETEVPAPVATRATQTYYRSLEKDFTKRLSRRVRIHHGAQKGRLELEYYGED